MKIRYEKWSLGDNLRLFLPSIIFGGAFSLIWLFFGESWEVGDDGDATQYMKMYRGEVATSPFGYRVLTPYLAGLLPWDVKTNFQIITIGCLILTTGVVSLYAKKISKSVIISVLTCFFWVFSYPFIYNVTTFVRADGPMLLLLAVAFFVSHKGLYPLGLMALIAIGVLSHEMMLILIPALWVDKLVSSDITGGNKYSFKYLILISLFSTMVFFGYRLYIHVIPATYIYENGISSMISIIKNYSGGWIKHCLRIYAAFGPAILYASFYAAPWNSIKRSIAYFSIFLCVSLMTLLAVDTLRVMAIFYIPVIFFAACFVANFYRNGKFKTVIVLLAIQIIYSILVYGHLRTFESSDLMNKLAALLSIAGLLLVIYIEYHENDKLRTVIKRIVKATSFL